MNFKSILPFLFLIIAVVLVTSLTGCASNSKNNADNQSQSGDSFYSKNLSSIQEYKLDNGIPVVIKQATNSIISLQVIIDGGYADVPVENAGLESVTLNMLYRSSSNHSYTEIQQIAYETGSSINCSSSRDSSSLSLNCLSKYFDTVFPVYMDCFLSPAFTEKDFSDVLNESLQNSQATFNQPFALMQYTVPKVVYEGKPYGASSLITEESLPNITLEAAKNHYKKILNASRIRIVAVGKIDATKLIADLNNTIGKVASTPWTAPTIPQPVITGDNVIIANESAAGSGYFAKLSSFPNISEDDFAAATITSDIYSTLLHNVVREDHGAVYAAGSSSTRTKSSFGVEVFYMVSDIENLPLWEKEAADLLSQGLIIDSRDETTGEFITVPLSEQLEGVKNKMINSLFSSSETNSGIGSGIEQGWTYANDVTWFLKLSDQIRTVTADDVINAFNKYWKSDNPARWIMVTGSNDVSRINPDLYR